MTHVNELRTDRLILTQVCPNDVLNVCRLHGDPDVMATLGGVRTPEQTRTHVEALSKHWEEHGFGPWIANESRSGEFVGMGGLRQVAIEEMPEIEIGYALMPAFWGQGLATELARTAAQIGFDALGLAVLVSFALPTNTRSRRVMEKIGFRYERDFAYKGHPQVLYRQTATMWQEAHGS